MDDMFSDEAIRARTSVKDQRQSDDIAAVVKQGTDNDLFHAESAGPLTLRLTVRAGRVYASMLVHDTSKVVIHQHAYKPA